MRFGIVGAGAVGCLFGARLTIAGHKVTLLHRDISVVQAIRRGGVRLRETDGTLTRVRVPVRRGPVRLPNIDVLMVAVKAYDTSEVAVSYHDAIQNGATVLSLQNGLGNVETLRSKFKNEVIAGSTTEGALLSSPGFVAHTGRGLTIIGDQSKANTNQCLRIKTALEEAGFHTRVSPNILGVLWTKAIVNAAINPLSALTRLPNGKLAEKATLREIAYRVMNEGIAVSQAVQIRLAGNPRNLWKKVLLCTKANKSSMLQDIESGKLTEIRQLNGAILAYGRRASVGTPVNETLTKLVVGLESS